MFLRWKTSFAISTLCLGLIVCKSNTYLNQKVTAPVFKDSTKVVANAYIGLRKQELNVSYAPVKYFFVTSDIFLGNTRLFLNSGINQFAYDVGLGAIPVRKRNVQFVLMASVGRGQINGMYHPYTFDYHSVKEARVKTHYDKLNFTAYLTRIEPDGSFSMGLRNSYVRYNDFYMERSKSFSPIKAFDHRTYSDTVSFNNKSFISIDPFVNVNMPLTEHFYTNFQMIYSIPTLFNIEYVEHSYNHYYNDHYRQERLTRTFPNYRKFVVNVGFTYEF